MKFGHPIAILFAAFTSLIGLIAFVGWMTETWWLTSVIPHQVFVTANASIGLICIGLALILKSNSEQRFVLKSVGNALASFCIVLGFLTGIQYLFDINLGIDEFFFNEFPGAKGTASPNRMSAYACVNFVLVGLSVLTLDVRLRSNKFPFQWFAIVTLVPAIQAILVYSYGVKIMTNVGSGWEFVQMAPITAVAWICSSISVLYSRPGVGLMSILTGRHPTAMFTRKVSVLGLILLLLFGALLARGDIGERYPRGFAASVLTTFALIVFMFVVLRAGLKLFEYQTQRAAALVNLGKAKELADIASQTKSSFLANISHEIRNPVGVIMGFAELLADPSSTSEERQQYVTTIRQSGQSLLTIIDDILDLSKVEAGKMQINIFPFDLNELLSDLSLIYQNLAQEKGILFVVSVHPQVPKKIHTDPVRLRQILTNLIGNAFKFTKYGQVTLIVRATTQSDNRVIVHFDVTDTGIGIKPMHVEHLFQPFSQGDSSTTRRYGGSGLGLALSKKIAHALKGDLVLVKTRPDQGTHFRLTIDAGATEVLLQKNDSKPTIAPFDHAVARSTQLVGKRLSGMNILIAEDALENQMLIKKFVTDEGANVEVVSNGRAAVDTVLNNMEKFDAILMDIQMPDMDGLEATKALRGKGYIKPVIALTAHAMSEYRDLYLNSGFSEHLSKPVRKEQLAEILSRYRATLH